MGESEEYRCFIGGLAWATTDRSLKDAFEKFGHLVEARVAVDKFSGRSRGFGFVTFDEKKSMEEAIEEMHGVDLDGRSINVEKAQPNQGGSGRDRDDRPRDRDRDRGRDRSRDFGGGGGGRGSGGGGDCFKCGKPGHFARECPGEGGGGGGGGRYGGRDGGRDDRYGGGREDRYGSDDGGRGSRSGPERNGDRYGGRSKDSGGGDRYSRDRSGPYERRSSGGGYRG